MLLPEGLMLGAGPGRVFFTAPCPASTPTGAPKLGAQALHCCAPIAVMPGRCGGGVVGKEGGVLVIAWLRGTLAPHQQEVRVSRTLSRRPQSRSSVPGFRVQVQAGEALRRGESFQLSRIAEQELPWPARQTQDCLQGERKATSCLWVSGKGRG